MNAGWWGATQGQADDRPGGGLDGALARLRARADGHDPGISVRDAVYIDGELTRLRALERVDDSWPGPGSTPGTYNRIVAEVQRSWALHRELHYPNSDENTEALIEHAVHVTISMLQRDAARGAS